MKITVNDMTCKNCVAKIEKNLMMNGIKSEINLDAKTIEIKDKDQEKAIKIITEVGYTPSI